MKGQTTMQRHPTLDEYDRTPSTPPTHADDNETPYPAYVARILQLEEIIANEQRENARRYYITD